MLVAIFAPITFDISLMHIIRVHLSSALSTFFYRDWQTPLEEISVLIALRYSVLPWSGSSSDHLLPEHVGRTKTNYISIGHPSTNLLCFVPRLIQVLPILPIQIEVSYLAHHTPCLSSSFSLHTPAYPNSMWHKAQAEKMRWLLPINIR